MEKSFSTSSSKRAFDMFKSVNAAGEALGVSRQLIQDDHFEGDSIILDNHKVANFGLCSYLGLGTDDRLVQGAIDATRRFGTSYSSSIAYTALGMYGDLTERLEKIFEARVIIAGTTTLGHFAALPVLVNAGETVFLDGQAHASLLSVSPTLVGQGAEVQMIPHNNLEVLEQRLMESDASRPVWYLTDGVFSMHGDTVPVEDLHSLLDRYPNLHVYCDDAHGFGWDGPRGSGTYLNRAGWHDRLVIAVGMAKSFGTMGGIIATTNEDFHERITLTGAPLIFGGPLPPPVLGASIASADIHLSDDLIGLKEQLNQRIRFVNDFSRQIGLPLAGRDHTPLWFLEVGASKHVLEMLSRMKEQGFFLNGAVFPVVPRGHGGLRFTVTNYNSMSQIEEMMIKLNNARLEIFGETEVEVDISEPKSMASDRDDKTSGIES